MVASGHTYADKMINAKNNRKKPRGYVVDKSDKSYDVVGEKSMKNMDVLHYFVAGINNSANIDPQIPMAQQIPKKINLIQSSFATFMSSPCTTQFITSSRVPKAFLTKVKSIMFTEEFVTFFTRKCQHDRVSWHTINNTWGTKGCNHDMAKTMT